MVPVIIRDETPSDIQSIYEITELAFQNHPFSQHTEQLIVSALRNAGALSISLVAELDGRVAGHIAISPVVISDGAQDWYGIGPLSVTPNLQRQGIGSMLMQTGLERLKAMGGRGCALVGDPSYYVRFGFRNRPPLIHEGIPQDVFLALSMDPSQDAVYPAGTVMFHEAFSAH
jgi:putative acetyltransferase